MRVPYQLDDRHQLVRHLRSGQLTDVYEGIDLRDGRRIAIEVLRPPYADDQDAISSFIGAHHAAMRLSHPNVAQIRTVRDSDGAVFMVREPVEHQTLDTLLTDRGRLPPRRASGIALGVCDALEHAHRYNTVHGALTAADILLTATGDVRVTGFGIATAMGTAVQASWVEPDRQTDLYGLGACLYHMLLGRAPFPGDAHAGERAASRAPEGLATVLGRLLSLDPATGYQSMGEAADDLRQYRRSALPASRRGAQDRHVAPSSQAPAGRRDHDQDEDEDEDEERFGFLQTGSYIFSRSAITVAASVVVMALIMVTAGQFGLGTGMLVTGDRDQPEDSATATTTDFGDGDDGLSGIGGATTSDEPSTTTSTEPEERDQEDEGDPGEDPEDDADQDGQDGDQTGEEPGGEEGEGDDTATTTTSSEPATTAPPDTTTTTEAPATVPNVVGLTESEASSRLSAAGLAMSSRRVRVYSADEDGRIVSQSPAAGSPHPESGTVSVEVGNYCVLIC